MQTTRNNLHNNHLPIPTHHTRNQDQQNHPRHPHVLDPCFSSTSSSSHHPNPSLLHSPSRLSPRLQPKPLLCWCMDCSCRLRQSSCYMICTKDILCSSHILQCCISCPTFYNHSESHHTGMVDLGLLRQYYKLGRHLRSPSRTE